MFYQWQWLLGLSLGFLTKSSRQSVLISKTDPPPQKKKNAGTLKTIVCQTAPLAKLPPRGYNLFMKYDVFRQNEDFFFKEWS